MMVDLSRFSLMNHVALTVATKSCFLLRVPVSKLHVSSGFDPLSPVWAKKMRYTLNILSYSIMYIINLQFTSLAVSGGGEVNFKHVIFH